MRWIALLDVDETCVMSNQLYGEHKGGYRYHESLFQALKNAKITDIYLFTSYTLRDIAKSLADEPDSAPSRLKLKQHLETQGFSVQGVATLLDPMYKQGAGAYYQSVIEPYEIQVLQGKNLLEGEEKIIFEAHCIQEESLCQNLEKPYLNQKGHLYKYLVEQLAALYPNESLGYVVVDDRKFCLESVYSIHEQQSYTHALVLLQAKPLITALDYQKALIEFTQEATVLLESIQSLERCAIDSPGQKIEQQWLLDRLHRIRISRQYFWASLGIMNRQSIPSIFDSPALIAPLVQHTQQFLEAVQRNPLVPPVPLPNILQEEEEEALQQAIIACTEPQNSHQPQTQAILEGLEKPHYVSLTMAHTLLSQDEAGKPLPKQFSGNSVVVRVGNVFFKHNPQQVLVEQSAYQVNRLLGGGLVAPTRFLTLTLPTGECQPLQASLAVEGFSLERLLRIPGAITGLQETFGAAELTTALPNLLNGHYYTAWLDEHPSYCRLSWEAECDLLALALFQFPKKEWPLEFPQFIQTPEEGAKVLKNSKGLRQKPLLPVLALWEQYPTLRRRDLNLTDLVYLPEIFSTLNDLYPNISASDVIERALNITQQIDVAQFSRHFLWALLFYPEDHKGDNFIVRVQRDLTGQLKPFTVTAIDNDAVVTSSVEARWNHLQEKMEYPLHLKSVWFTLESLLQKPIDAEAIKILLSLEVDRAALQRWGAVITYRLFCESIWNRTPIRLEEAGLQTPINMQEIEVFQKRLKDLQTIILQGGSLTHEVLFLKMEPIASRCYQVLRRQYPDPQQLLHRLYGEDDHYPERSQRTPVTVEQTLREFLGEPKGKKIRQALDRLLPRKTRLLLCSNRPDDLENVVGSGQKIVILRQGTVFSIFYLKRGETRTLTEEMRIDQTNHTLYPVLQGLKDTAEIKSGYIYTAIYKAVIQNNGKIEGLRDLQKQPHPKETLLAWLQNEANEPGQTRLSSLLSKANTTVQAEVLQILSALKQNATSSFALGETVLSSLAVVAAYAAVPRGMIRLLQEEGQAVVLEGQGQKPFRFRLQDPELLYAVIASSEDAALLPILMAYGVPVKAMRHDYTPLHFAARFNRSALIPTLVEAGASLEQCNREGATALDKAIQYGQWESVHMLLLLGAGQRVLDANIKKLYQERPIAGSLWQDFVKRNRNLAWQLTLEALMQVERTPEAVSLESDSGTHYLRSEVYKQIFGEQDTLTRENQYGRRAVNSIMCEMASDVNKVQLKTNLERTSADLGAHLKENPELSGRELMVYHLARCLLGPITPPVALCRIDKIIRGWWSKIYVQYPVLISQTVFGMMLKDALDVHPLELKKIDSKSFSEAVILAMLINPEDGKEDNYILEPFYKNKKLYYRLMSIDNDHAFINAFNIGNEEEEVTSPKELNVKTVLYCLEGMQEPLHAEVREQLLMLDAYSVLKNWLEALQQEQKKIERLFGQEREALKKAQIDIDILFKPSLVEELYQKIVRLQRILQQFSHCSLLEILKALNPPLGARYQSAFKQSDTPKERFDWLTEGCFKKESAPAHEYWKLCLGNEIADYSRCPSDSILLIKNKSIYDAYFIKGGQLVFKKDGGLLEVTLSVDIPEFFKPFKILNQSEYSDLEKIIKMAIKQSGILLSHTRTSIYTTPDIHRITQGGMYPEKQPCQLRLMTERNADVKKRVRTGTEIIIFKDPEGNFSVLYKQKKDDELAEILINKQDALCRLLSQLEFTGRLIGTREPLYKTVFERIEAAGGYTTEMATRPDQALQRLEQIHQSRTQLTLVAKALQEGNIEWFMQCLEDDKAAIVNGKVPGFDFKAMRRGPQPDLKKQNRVLKALTSVSFQILRLSGCEALTDLFLKQILKKSTGLISLELKDCPNITEASLSILNTYCSHLVEIRLEELSFIEVLELKTPELRVLQLYRCQKLKLFQIQALNLERLSVRHCENLKRLTTDSQHLTQLCILNSGLSDSALKHLLAEANHLQTVTLRDNRFLRNALFLEQYPYLLKLDWYKVSPAFIQAIEQGLESIQKVLITFQSTALEHWIQYCIGHGQKITFSANGLDIRAHVLTKLAKWFPNVENRLKASYLPLVKQREDFISVRAAECLGTLNLAAEEQRQIIQRLLLTLRATVHPWEQVTVARMLFLFPLLPKERLEILRALIPVLSNEGLRLEVVGLLGQCVQVPEGLAVILSLLLSDAFNEWCKIKALQSLQTLTQEEVKETETLKFLAGHFQGLLQIEAWETLHILNISSLPFEISEKLCDLLQDKDSLVRLTALEKLLTKKWPLTHTAVRTLLDYLLKREDRFLNGAVLELLGGVLWSGNIADEIRSTLYAQMNSPDPWTRVRASEACYRVFPDAQLSIIENVLHAALVSTETLLSLRAAETLCRMPRSLELDAKMLLALEQKLSSESGWSKQKTMELLSRVLPLSKRAEWIDARFSKSSTEHLEAFLNPGYWTTAVLTEGNQSTLMKLERHLREQVRHNLVNHWHLYCVDHFDKMLLTHEPTVVFQTTPAPHQYEAAFIVQGQWVETAGKRLIALVTTELPEDIIFPDGRRTFTEEHQESVQKMLRDICAKAGIETITSVFCEPSLITHAPLSHKDVVLYHSYQDLKALTKTFEQGNEAVLGYLLALDKTKQLLCQWVNNLDFAVVRTKAGSVKADVLERKLLNALLGGNYPEINLSNCQTLTDEFLESLLKYSSGTRSLNLSGCQKLTNAAISILEQYASQIEDLNLKSLPLTRIESQLLFKGDNNVVSFLKLKTLNLRDCNSLIALKIQAPQLEQFWITATLNTLIINGKPHPKSGKQASCSLIEIASGKGNLKVVQWWIEVAKVLLEAGNTAMLEAATFGHLKVFRWLLAHGGSLTEKNKDGFNALHLAAWRGHLPLVQWLVTEAKLSPSEPGGDGYTAMLLASGNGYLPVVKWLLANGSSLTEKNKDGDNALHLAARYGHVSLVKWLVTNGGLSANERGSEGRTAILHAVVGGHLRVLQSLESKASSGNDTINFLVRWFSSLGTLHQDTQGNNALHLAAMQGHLPLVQWLVTEGYFLSVSSRRSDGYTPVLLALEGGHLEVVQWLLERGAALTDKDKDKDGNNALHLAALHGHLPLVQWLVTKSHFSLAESRSDGCTAVLLAAIGGHLEVLQWLLAHGGSLTDKDKDGSNALHLAAIQGHLPLIQWLITEAKFLPSEPGIGGYTVVLLAALAGHLPILQWLLAHGGGSLTDKDKDGSNALHLAAIQGHLPLVQWLVTEGKLSTSEATAYNRTAALYAVGGGHLEVLQWLLEHGASLTDKDKDGDTALHYASESGHLEIIQWLIERAKVNHLVQNNAQWTVLLLAALNGHFDALRWLLSDSKLPWPAADNTDCASLYFAALNGDNDVIQKFFPADAVLQCTVNDQPGTVTLLLAASAGHFNIVRYLINQVSPENRKLPLETVLFWMAGNGRLELLQWAFGQLAIPASTVIKDDYGNTPLHRAASNGHVNIVQWLLDNGANPEERNVHDTCALDLAKNNNHSTVIELLEAKVSRQVLNDTAHPSTTKHTTHLSNDSNNKPIEQRQPLSTLFTIEPQHSTTILNTPPLSPELTESPLAANDSFAPAPLDQHPLIANEVENTLNLPTQSEIQAYAKQYGIPLRIQVDKPDTPHGLLLSSNMQAKSNPDTTSKSSEPLYPSTSPSTQTPFEAPKSTQCTLKSLRYTLVLKDSTSASNVSQKPLQSLHFAYLATPLKASDVNVQYQYEDYDIQAILNARLRHLLQEHPKRFVKILGAVDDIFETQLKTRLEQEKASCQDSRILLIPCNLGNAHWVGILLELGTEQQIERAEYFDSLGSRNIPERLQQQVLQVYGRRLRFMTLLLQKDSTSCGAYTVENLLWAALQITPPNTTTDAIRALHLEALKYYNPTFYERFYKRQRENRPTVLDLSVQRTYLNNRVRFSKPMLHRIVTICICLSKMPDFARHSLKEAFKARPIYADNHALHLNGIRTALKELGYLNDPALVTLLKELFGINWQLGTPLELDTARFLIEYNEILAIANNPLSQEDLVEWQVALTQELTLDAQSVFEASAEFERELLERIERTASLNNKIAV